MLAFFVFVVVVIYTIEKPGTSAGERTDIMQRVAIMGASITVLGISQIRHLDLKISSSSTYREGPTVEMR